MTFNKLYYSSKNKEYYYKSVSVICNCCNEEINKVLAFIVSYSKKKSTINEFCINCIKKAIKGVVTEYKLAVITENLPKDSILVFLKPPGLSNSNSLSVFDVASPLNDSKIKSDTSNYVIKDKCRVSHNPDRNIMLGCESNKEITENRIMKLNKPVNNFDKFITEIKQRAPVIEYKNKKLLGCKSGAI